MSCWRHEDGQEHAIAAVKAALEPHADFLSKTNVGLCAATDFKAKVSREELDAAKDMLLGLLEVDARGGCFRQSDAAAGVKQALDAKEKMAEMIESTRQLQCEPDQTVGLIAYKIRILLAAARLQCSHDLLPKFHQALTKGVQNNVSAEAEKRQRRLASRPNPFICFQTEPNETANDDDNEAEVVATYFDGQSAQKIFSNGDKMLADQYLAGTDGFIRAYWANDKTTMALELPNSMLKDETHNTHKTTKKQDKTQELKLQTTTSNKKRLKRDLKQKN